MDSLQAYSKELQEILSRCDLSNVYNESVKFERGELESWLDKFDSHNSLLIEIIFKNVSYSYLDNWKFLFCLLDCSLYLTDELSKGDKSLVYILLEEILDIQTISTIKQTLWSYMVSRQNELVAKKQLTGSKSPGTVLIRLCNSLVKRLSKNQDAQFSGTVAMYLARAFPLSEKSGLNIRGSYNTENVTTYDENDEDELYRTFWSLQAIFCNPTQLFIEDNRIETFKTKLEKVLKVLKGTDFYRKKRRAKLHQKQLPQSKPATPLADEEIFVAKWLTRKDLFELQLKDTSFRRIVQCQIIILVNLLLSVSAEAKAEWTAKTNKSIMYSYTLSPENAKYFLDLYNSLLSAENYFDDPSFLSTIHAIISRDSKTWQLWKLKNCPSFEKCSTSFDSAKLEDKYAQLKQPRKKFWNAMGTPALSKMWKIQTGLERLRSNNSPKTEEYYQRYKKLKQQQEENKNELSKEDNQEIAEQIESLSWRGLRAARDEGYWVKFGLVTPETGFGGLFEPESLDSQLDSQKASEEPEKDQVVTEIENENENKKREIEENGDGPQPKKIKVDEE